MLCSHNQKIIDSRKKVDNRTNEGSRSRHLGAHGAILINMQSLTPPKKAQIPHTIIHWKESKVPNYRMEYVENQELE